MVDTQPTILVKKADGTTERITLAELKARQTKPVAVVATIVPEKIKIEEPKIELSKIEQPKIEKPHGLVIGPIEKNLPELNVLAQNKIVQAPLKSEDLKPLLHEVAPDSPHTDSNIATARVDQVSKIILGLSFKVPPQFENRLRSGVQLRLKDIRSEADTRDLCLRSIKDGGLGLTQSQADELVSKTHPTASPLVKKDQISHAPILPPMPVIEIMKKSDKEAAVEKFLNPIRSNPPQSLKPLMHDVKAKPASMSPLDEIQYFSLIDLRRLSSQPSEAVSRLKQKFVNLKDESFLLFMDSWNAWRNSPLYQSYTEVVDSALSQKLSLNTVLDSKEKISLPEIEALVKMEKELDI
ncbi:MAG: hypothetical protein WCT11_01700 [Candidatus Magasanikbacteria bacterium]